MTELKSQMRDSMKTNRLEALIDGTFAIAMTILVFDLKVPEIAETLVHEQIAQKLFNLWPSFVGYFISFILLGVYWVGQHNIFKYIKHTDRAHLWINVFFLAVVCLLPFTTSLLSKYGSEQIVEIIYGANLILIGLFSFLNWDYATIHHRLVDHAIDERLVALVKKRILVAPVVCLIAMVVSFFASGISFIIYILIPLYYIFPGKIDDYWKTPAVPHKH